jgi:hypothetical protein
MTSSQTTPCGYGSRIALRLCGTTAVDQNGHGNRGLIVIASEAKKCMAHPQARWIASLRSQ